MLWTPFRFRPTRKTHRNPIRRRPFRPALELLECRMVPSTVDWTLQGDGNFNVDANWTVEGSNPPVHRVPVAGDRAIIPGERIVTSSSNVTIDSIGAGALNVTGGIFTVNNQFNGSSVLALFARAGATFRTAGGETDIFGTTINGTLDTAAGAVFRFHRGTTVLDTGAVLAGAGHYVMNGDVFGAPEVVVSTTVAAPSDFEFANGLIDGNGTLNVGGSFTDTALNGTTIAGNLTVNVLAGGSLNLPANTGGLSLDHITLNNHGTVNWTGTMSLGLSSGALFNNRADGTVNDQNDHNVGFGGTVANAGTWTKTSPWGSGVTFVDSTFNNTGNLIVTSGLLRSNRGGLSQGAFALDTGGGFSVSGGTFTMQIGATLSGPGLLQATGGLFVVNANVSPAALQVTGGTLAINVPMTTQSVTLSGGSLAGSGALTVTDTFNWTGGIMAGSGTTTVSAAAAFTLSGPDGKILDENRTLVNAAAAAWNGTGNLYVAVGATFRNTGTVTAQNSQAIRTYFYDFSPPGTVENLGTWTFASQGSNDILAIFNNSGTVDVQGGTLQFFKGGRNTGTFANVGTLAVNAGSYVLDPGTAITASALVRIAGGALVDNADLSVANLTLTGGVLTGSGTLTVTSALTWSAGSTMAGSGTTMVADGATLTISGNDGKLLDETRTLTNAGAGTWSGTGNFYLALGATFRNTGLFTVQNNQTIESYVYDFSPPGTVANAGTWTKTSSGGTNIHVVFNNSGTVNVAGGSLLLSRGGSSTGTFDTAAGATLNFAADYTLNDGTSFIDAGFARVQGGSLNVVGNVTAANFGLDGGAVVGVGSLTVSDPENGGNFDWTGGSIGDLIGSLTVAVDATTTIRGNGGKGVSGRTLNLSGSVNWTGGNIALSSGGTIVIQTDGVFNILSDNINVTGAGTFRNLGAVTKQNLPGTTQFAGGIVFLNDDPGASVSVQSGILTIDNFTQNAGTTDVSAGARLDSASTVTLQGGVLSGAGAINANVRNVAGTVSPGGDGTAAVLTITGNYVQEALGSLNIDIGGLNVGTDYDRLVVSGTTTLNGTVNINFLPSYAAAANDQFRVLTSTAHTNDFATYNVSGLDPAFQMGHAFTGGNLDLTIMATGGFPGTGRDGGSETTPVAIQFWEMIDLVFVEDRHQ